MYALLNTLLERLNPTVLAGRTFAIGFLTPERDLLTLRFESDGAHLADGVQNADAILQGTRALFETLFHPSTPAAVRVQRLNDLRVIIDYPWLEHAA